MVTLNSKDLDTISEALNDRQRRRPQITSEIMEMNGLALKAIRKIASEDVVRGIQLAAKYSDLLKDEVYDGAELAAQVIEDGDEGESIFAGPGAADSLRITPESDPFAAFINGFSLDALGGNCEWLIVMAQAYTTGAADLLIDARQSDDVYKVRTLEIRAAMLRSWAEILHMIITECFC